MEPAGAVGASARSHSARPPRASVGSYASPLLPAAGTRAVASTEPAGNDGLRTVVDAGGGAMQGQYGPPG